MKTATGREIEKAIRVFMPVGKAYNTEELSFFCKDKIKPKQVFVDTEKCNCVARYLVKEGILVSTRINSKYYFKRVI